MITIQPDHELALNHRAYHIRGALDGRVLVASDKGDVTVVGRDQKILYSRNYGKRIRGVSACPDVDGPCAITLEERVVVVDSTGDIEHEVPGDYEDAWFDSRGDLWAARGRWTPETGRDRNGFQVERFDTTNLSTPADTLVSLDPFGSSNLHFPDLPCEAPFPVHVTAGQDGQAICWVTKDKTGFSGELFHEFESCSGADLREDGQEFIMFAEEDELRRYSWPDFRLLGRMSKPDDTGRGDMYFGLVANYLSPTKALIRFEGSFLYVVDLEQMAVDDEVIVAGHEAKPMRTVYKSSNSDDLVTDLTHVFIAGDRLVSAHERRLETPGQSLGLLAWWPKDALS